MKQIMLVRNKRQLIAAVGCVIDFEGITEIILQRKAGITTYFFDPINSAYYNRIGYHTMRQFNYAIRQVRSRIRKTETICFS